MTESLILEERKDSIKFGFEKTGKTAIKCESNSVSGAVSQRACVYCGARVVLNPITDAFHIVHGPIGCASYTWDIRGSLTSGSDLYRNSFSTDLTEQDIVFGGEKKLSAAIDEVVQKHNPKVIFVYATCIVGVIGDDVEAVCRHAEKKHGTRVIPVKSPGFSGNKSYGYKMACNAILELLKPHNDIPKTNGVNILGDFNLAGEMWIIKNYLNEIGIPVVSTITGDAGYDNLIKAPSARLNLVQCAGSMTYLAKKMEEKMDIPFIKVSFFGVEDTSQSLIRIAEAIGTEENIQKAKQFTQSETERLRPMLEKYRSRLEGKKAAIYVGGGFKAISLIRQFNQMGIETVVVGTQTGKPEEYEIITNLVGQNAVILDDANPAELETFMKEKEADILVGGVKERPLAYKLGIAFCDHNHERKHALAGYEGVVNFTKEINLSMNSPVWEYIKQET
ncbi:nitrogenase MoFe cofactor biosynthesis protein NifE [Ruminiclostridium papyrosolvens DSM 2782]|uniref:Nitrogenase iron-molybdenum cofactor biosynthesis protein NifE n=1 Tax=Ruminiclostridium papyrosolvens DSM 2782 TaxID=588581 RepID=F1TH63_9FIRM|nr:nitrogenase iron-molybdenum cofactor biosynthesis protein NifE [Ruminiclostridium papyrosolvens]EGD46303.1 nitrogenase MoFe cofactor biosynthesis protein NifE [Ruminiclostridium papyrosolvens DSM 2782]WES32977.1 nitrogenase iron-molybdenum cofactor biosynthesis protein NifE [Ruminiclostridium papyrosolvens DSM 2782]